jgi:hypothetical protein
LRGTKVKTFTSVNSFATRLNEKFSSSLEQYNGLYQTSTRTMQLLRGSGKKAGPCVPNFGSERT